MNKIGSQSQHEQPLALERMQLGKQCRGLLFRAAVFLHALRKSPFMVARALYWRLLGMKVRARNTIGALAGRSVWAYRLWMATRETIGQPVAAARHGAIDAIHILLLASPTSRWSEIEATLASIRASGFGNPVILFDPNRIWEDQSGGAGRDVQRVTACGELFKRLQHLSGSWLCAIQAGDRVSPDCLARYGGMSGISGLAVIYGDDDEIDAGGHRRNPYFKPDWNGELFEFQDYISFSCLFRLDAGILSSLDADLDIASQLKSLIGKTIAQSGQAPLHISHVLHHRRHRAYASETRPSPHTVSEAAPTDSVSIVVPTKNRSDLLRICLSGLNRLSHPNYEVIIVDHDSDDPDTIEYLNSIDDPRYKITRWSGPFNYSAINNHAVSMAGGEFICFLNNDIEMLDSQWLTIMLRQARRPHVGAVGAKLLYPDHTIQHAGVVIGVGGAAGHAHRYLPNDDDGYFNRAHLPQYSSAVTAACLLVKREKFHAVGGLDEINFPVAFNDVDFCLKLGDAGWHNLYEPRAVLIHHESKSRGSDRLKRNRDRFARELQALKDKWHTDRSVDKFHNVNLSRLSEQFQIDAW